MKYSVYPLILAMGYCNAQWSIEVLDTDYVIVCTSLALDSEGQPHIAYSRGWDPMALKYAYFSDSTWNIEFILGSTDHPGTCSTANSQFARLMLPSLMLDGSNNEHISFTLFEPPFNARVFYGCRLGSDWEFIDIGHGYSAYSSLALNDIDEPFIAYSSPWGLEYAYFNGSEWISEIAFPRDMRIWYYNSLALNSSGNPSISFHDYGSMDLLYAFQEDSTWYSDSVETAGFVGKYSSLCLDSEGNPIIAYSDSTNGDLKLAHWDGMDWYIETIDSVGIVGRYASIDLDSNEYPHVAYYDASEGALKYAYWDGVCWHIETVDSNGNVGMYTSMKLDSYDHPHISYIDQTNFNLMYAYKYDTGVDIDLVNDVMVIGTPRPNPFAVSTDISIELLQSAHLLFSVYDLSGRLVYEQDRGIIAPVELVLSWNGASLSDEVLSNGVYFLICSTEHDTFTTKVVLFR